MKFATRDGSTTPEEGLKHAFDLFRDGRPSEAALMFLAYGDTENEISVVTEGEHTELATHLKQVCAFAALFNMICDEQVVPALTDENEPGYKVSPWASES
jgi:hypothetical protein